MSFKVFELYCCLRNILLNLQFRSNKFEEIASRNGLVFKFTAFAFGLFLSKFCKRQKQNSSTRQITTYFSPAYLSSPCEQTLNWLNCCYILLSFLVMFLFCSTLSGTVISTGFIIKHSDKKITMVLYVTKEEEEGRSWQKTRVAKHSYTTISNVWL